MIANQVTIIGIGLIGGSVAMALKECNVVKTVKGYDIDQECLQQACQLGVIDSYSLDLEEAVHGADIIVIASPLSTSASLFKVLSRSINPGSVVTDVGSVKIPVMDVARLHLGDFITRFVPGHPIAGKEQHGVAASSAELFVGHRVILTPTTETDHDALALITMMWSMIGAEVVNLELVEHDNILAATSHLPHILAYALVDFLSTIQQSDDIFDFAAGGFADFTRIASSDPGMWRDICLLNHEQLLQITEKFRQHLGEITETIRRSDEEKLLDIFVRAKQSRDQFIQRRKQQI